MSISICMINTCNKFLLLISVSEVLEQEQAANAESRLPTARARPLCSVCKHPMKGYKNVRDCPKNQQNS